MTQHQKNIAEFTRLAGQDLPQKPCLPSREVRELRVRLIAEELCEFASALGVDLDIKTSPNSGQMTVYVDGLSDARSLIESYDAILDLDYVVTGAACALGLDMEAGQSEVHRSNMSKFIDGHRRIDGKWVKGPSYSPANLAPIIEAQSK